MTKFITLVLIFITTSVSQAQSQEQPAPAMAQTISQDITFDGPKAMSLYLQLRAPEKRSSRNTITKNAKSADGSWIGCEVYENGDAYCVIGLRGLVPH